MEITEEAPPSPPATSAPPSPPAPSAQYTDTDLRYKIREYARQKRKDLRSNATDALRFGLGQIKDEIADLENLGIKDVQGLAGRIKRRKRAESQDLYRLSHAFLQGNENIDAFAKIQGATQVIIKELTGTNVERQIDAAECLCNFSLGEAHVSEKITVLAGSYLVTLLDSLHPRLKRSCLWTIANILDTSKKSAKILLQMHLTSKLWKLYTQPSNDGNTYYEDAASCLYLIGLNAASDMTAENRQFIAKQLHMKQPTEAAAEYYMFIICQFEIVSLERELCVPHFQHLLNFFMAKDLSNSANKMHFVYGVRVLANMFATRPFVSRLEFQAVPFVNGLNQLFALQDTALTLDLMQLLKNMMDAQVIDSDLVLDHVRVYAWPGAVESC